MSNQQCGLLQFILFKKINIKRYYIYIKGDLAEWSTRFPAKELLFKRVGSNPTIVVFFVFLFVFTNKNELFKKFKKFFK